MYSRNMYHKAPLCGGPVYCLECLRKAAHADMEQCLREHQIKRVI